MQDRLDILWPARNRPDFRGDPEHFPATVPEIELELERVRHDLGGWQHGRVVPVVCAEFLRVVSKLDVGNTLGHRELDDVGNG